MQHKIMLAVTTATAALAFGLTACGTSTPAAAPASLGATVAATQQQHSQVSPSAAVIAGELAHAGLGVTKLITWTPATDPNHLMGRQGGYTSKVAWVDPAASAAGDPSNDVGGTEFGGGIEVFPDAASAQSRLAELQGFKPPFGDGYDYLAGTALLRLSNFLAPAQAAAYKAAFTKAAS